MIANLVAKTRPNWRFRRGHSRRPRPTLTHYPIVTMEKLRFADTDQNGHISNAVCAVLCQSARMEALSDSNRIALAPTHRFLIVELQIAFLAELHWPGTVEIGTRFENVGRTSVHLDQAVFIDGLCVATAQSTIVLIDAATRRPSPIPASVAGQIRRLGGRQTSIGSRLLTTTMSLLGRRRANAG